MMREQGRDRDGEKPKKGMRRAEGGRGRGSSQLSPGASRRLGGKLGRHAEPPHRHLAEAFPCCRERGV